MIYLDNAATTLIKPPGVREAVAEAIGSMGNPGRSGHIAATHAADAVFRCRTIASELFDLSVNGVVFTLNATHALNIAIRTLVAPNAKVVISGFEHNSVTRLLHALNAEITVAGDRLFDTAYSVESFDRAITPDTAAVIVNHVSNVFGFIQPLEEIAALCRKKHVPLIVDAAQSAGVLPLSCEKLGAAFIAMPGHKSLFGPQGTGLLLCNDTPEPLLYGGTGSYSLLASMPEELPDRIEAGTLNVPGICGLSAGLQFISEQGTDRIRTHEEALRKILTEKLQQLPDCRVFCGSAANQVGTVSAVFENTDVEAAAQWLAERGIAVRAGLHCAPLAHRSAGTEKTGTVRFGVSALNTVTEAFAACETLAKKDGWKPGKF